MEFKILTLNCKPDLSYFTNRGLKIETIYKKVNKTFPISSGSDTINELGQIVTTSYPDPTEYLEKYNTGEYDAILVGYNRKNYKKYKNIMGNTGGKTFLMPLMPYRTYFAVYCLENNNYAIHEFEHILCAILITKYGVIAKDFMDIDLHKRPYYLNNEPENPLSNYAQTWNQIKPYLYLLNGETIPTVTLTRIEDDGVQCLGILKTDGFICRTLERPWKNNAKNISCIPTGTYNCVYSFSPKFLKYTYELQNVINRLGIRIHSGNYFFDIEGCILLGSGYKDINKDNRRDIIDSRKTIKLFEEKMGKKLFNLVIK